VHNTSQLAVDANGKWLGSGSDETLQDFDHWVAGYGIALTGCTESEVKNNRIEDNPDIGLLIMADSTNDSIEANVILRNGAALTGEFNDGILVLGNTEGNAISYNNIVGNGACGVEAKNISGGPVNATFDWWGDENGPTTGYLTTNGDRVSANVTFVPWLKSEYPPANPVAYKSDTVTDASLDARTECDAEVVVTGSTNVTVAKYPSNPTVGNETFSGDIGKYIDVKIDNATNVTELTIKLYYTDDEVAGKDESSLRMHWWSGVASAWQVCSESGVDRAANYIWAKITSTSTPSLSDLVGTPFGAGAGAGTLNAEFWATPTRGVAPLTVQFSDESSKTTNPPYIYLWNFGDGGTSTEANPSHIYWAPGKYTVSLTITDNLNYSNTETKTNYIVAIPPPPPPASFQPSICTSRPCRLIPTSRWTYQSTLAIVVGKAAFIRRC
jgi:PKD repeat protein